jgi:hypothetical protein
MLQAEQLARKAGILMAGSAGEETDMTLSFFSKAASLL